MLSSEYEEAEFLELPDNYLECQRQDEFQTSCKIKPNNIVLEPRKDIRLSYNFQYLSGCEISAGTWPSTLAIRQGDLNAFVNFSQNTWRNLAKFNGADTITVIDSNPLITASRKFQPDKNCFLKLRYRTELSETSKSTLAGLIEQLDGDREFIKTIKTQTEGLQTPNTSIEKLELAHMITLQKISDRAEKNLAEAQKILAVAERNDYVSERKFVSEFEKDIEHSR